MRKNTAGQVVAFQAVSTTDGSAVTTGTPAVYYTVDGGTQGTGAGTTTHEGNGCWSYAPAQAETNGNHVVFTFTLTGAVSQSVNLYPVAFDPTDSVRIGLTALPNAAAGAAGGLPTDSTGKTAFNDLSDAGVRTAVGLASANLDEQLADLPAVAEIADAVWEESTSWHTTAGTYGGRIVRSINSNVSVQITGAGHIASDVHECQPDVLTSDATAASFVAEVQAGLATSAALAIVDGIVGQLKSRSGYTMSILAGAIANAQNAAEAYTITLDGTVYGVTYSGLDSSGNRTGATLTET